MSQDRRRVLHSLFLSALLGPLQVASADPWAAPGDGLLRHDLQLLADAGIVKAPLSSWPVSWGEVLRDLAAAGDGAARPAHVAAALSRVRGAAGDATRSGEWRGHARIAGSSEPMTLTRFSTVPGEDAEIEASLNFVGDVFAFRLQGAVVADPADGQEVIADGSYAAAVLGNWIVSAGLIDRWWGPGWEGSLIYGSVQRPIPSITLERNFSDPFDSRWLSWIGQWRVNVTMGQLEGHRDDFDDTRFFGMRVTWKPHQRLELGLSRSAQWCGRGRPCGFGTFWDLFTGNDNDQVVSGQPGNQLAGADFRWSVPWVPLALYGQAIGEDEAGGFPSKYLGLIGAETWGGWGDRSWRVHAEYADTACVFNEDPPEFGCAYRNVIYTDGYQYRGSPIGHAIDGDSEQLAFGAMLVNADGSSWELAAQNAKINRASANAVHSVARFATRIRSADVYHHRALFGGSVKVGVGYEDRESAVTGEDAGDLRGFVEWVGAFE